jgi:hypothetical protein
MKKVLYIPFFSQQDKETGEFILESDSNMHIMRNIVKVLNGFECDVDVALPYEPSGIMIGDYNYKYFKPFNNNVMQRYHFEANDYINLFSEKYDLIINNTPPVTKNIYATYYYLYKKFPKIVSITHFVDYPSMVKVPDKISYWSRQVDSAEVSNLSVFISSLSKKMFLEESGLDNSDKITVWKMSFSIEEIDLLINKVEKYPVKTIVFPNRISSTGYSNHEIFIEAVNILWKKRKDFQVIFTNTTKYYSKNMINNSIPCAFFVDTEKRKDYLNMLSRSHVAVSLFLNDVHGGLAIRESIYCGCVPVVTNVYDYVNIVPEDYSYFVESDLSNLVEVLDAVLDASYYNEYKEKVVEDSFEYNKINMENDIRRILYG